MTDKHTHIAISRYPNGISQFYAEHRVQKQMTFTHTSLYSPAASFYIPEEDHDDFYFLYAKALKENVDLYLTEKHIHVSPILIDIDMRFSDLANLERRYTYNHIETICNVYGDLLNKYIWPTSSGNFDFYVFEKKSARLDKTYVKDGVHVMLPDLVTRHALQHILRKLVIKNSKIKAILEEIKVVNETRDVFDEAVIDKNNWLLLGSKKRDGEPYLLTQVFRYACETGTIECVTEEMSKFESTTDMVKYFSIRNKQHNVTYRAEFLDEITTYANKASEKNAKRDLVESIMNANESNIVENISDNFEEAKTLVGILPPSNADDYTFWAKLGWCLRNIDYRLLETWETFSRNSPKYRSGECEKSWSKMRTNGGLNIGSLRMWARNENPSAYAEVAKNDLAQLIYQSATMTHYDVCKVVYAMFKNQYVCASLASSKIWYEYKDHRWHYNESGIGLRNKLSIEVWKKYSEAIVHYTTLAMATVVQVEQDRYQGLVKKFNTIAMKLRDQNFKKHIMDAATEQFYVEKFEEKLDCDTHLIGFNNGVYELRTSTFRPGEPEDHISNCTHVDYIEYDKYHPICEQINAYLGQVLTITAVRNYILRLFASFLDGQVNDHKFYIWTGSGANSKSKLVDLFENSFGDYCVKLPVALLTNKRAASNAASSEIVRCKGKRFAVLQEPGEKEVLNVGLLKELSGADKITARALYREPIEFRPQMKMVLLCNTLPEVPTTDNGSWRRIRAVNFTSKFVDNPKEPGEFPIDLNLSDKMITWHPYFMSMLLNEYKSFKSEGIIEPAEVTESTNKYRCANDRMAQYFNASVVKREERFTLLSDMYDDYRSWFKSEGLGSNPETRSGLGNYISTSLKCLVVRNSIEYIQGYVLKTSIIVEE